MTSLASFAKLVILFITIILVNKNVECDDGYIQKKDIGACLGFNGDSLPSATAIAFLYNAYGITKMRIFEPNNTLLEALRGVNITLTLGVRNQDIPLLASGQEGAERWFSTNVQPYVNDVHIPYITVGNEVVPDEFSESIIPAMQNLLNVIHTRGIKGMAVSTVVSMNVLTSTFPPSTATFSEQSQGVMAGILQLLSQQQAPLLINAYPYFAYASDPTHIRLDYALFNATGAPVVQDGHFAYMNMFDAMVDSFYWSMEKLGAHDVNVAVSETGWPHAGNGELTTPELAKTYNANFMQKTLARQGTPKRPNSPIEGFIFSIIDENLKSEGVEQNFGVFKSTLEANYDIFDF